MQLSHIAQVHIAYFTHAAGMILCAIVFRQTERKPCTSYQTYFSFPSPHPFPAHAHHEEKYGWLARLLACADIGAPRVSTSLTLGALAQRGLQLSFRVYVRVHVCLSVCLSATILTLQATRRLVSDTNSCSATRARKITWRFC